jgi:hypothetical protein
MPIKALLYRANPCRSNLIKLLGLPFLRHLIRATFGKVSLRRLPACGQSFSGQVTFTYSSRKGLYSLFLGHPLSSDIIAGIIPFIFVDVTVLLQLLNS